MNSEIKDKTNWQPNSPIFADRLDAGWRLGEELRLRGYGDEPAVVVAIPRGGVPVALAVAQAIHATLEIIIPRKLRLPDDPGTSFGAITPDGTMILDLPLVEEKQLTIYTIKQVALETLEEVRRQMRTYCGECPPLELAGQTAILVDDGLSSGFTMLAAVRALHRLQPARMAVAVPVSSLGSLDRLVSQVDDLICLVERDDSTFSVADCYQSFDDLTDAQVQAFLAQAQTGRQV